MTDEALAYRRWLDQHGLSPFPAGNALVGMMRRLGELDDRIERAAQQRDASQDTTSRRRADRKVERLEREQARIYDAMDAYPPDVQVAVYERVAAQPEPPRIFTGPTRFAPVPDHQLNEED